MSNLNAFLCVCQPEKAVLSQQLLTHMAAKQKPKSLTLGWSEQEGIELGFD
ncbi:hypothetical protein SIL11_08665 [Scandinavium sp. V105_1]|uniref:Uncharacterized protein n=1 Tax=Scandinavium lactucae TaxID=3095028 RepID=A0ABU4QJW8_9ENTR|nr:MULTISPECIES: hypothetical protein [unclassified Scandinavium]MDX6039167.1 hypothetical protein [Scandinavium sp. V105_6]MDX6050238.1 hypothetical protein [Scandinavium sp. V105_1]